jgi:hypothetical protein
LRGVRCFWMIHRRMTCCMSAQVAILRTEGTNGDREMTGSFYNAGFEAWCGVRCVLLGGRFD